MSTPSASARVAVFDVGKTNTKLTVVDANTHDEIWSVRRANEVVVSEHGRELDIVAIERWLIDALSRAPDKDRIEAIVPVAHGAAAVLVGDAGEVIAAPDYEDKCYETVSAEYDRARDEFADTFSPNLPCGLNLGRQLFYLQHTRAPQFARTRHILLYPQYWAWRLSGALASELTSLGCHTDLWRPREARFSNLARAYGWAERFPERRFARDAIGTLSPEMAVRTGLDTQCRIACGIHDSNASYLRFLIGRERDRFVVVSSGTWTIVMANGGELARLEETRDMLANVNAFGAAVPTARFMGGREYEAIASGSGIPTMDIVQALVRTRTMALPSFATAGPFSGRVGRILNATVLDAASRASLATLYSASMTALLVESLGGCGEIFVDGPLASNPICASLLAALTCETVRRVPPSATGGRVASFLAGVDTSAEDILEPVPPADVADLVAYHAQWRERVMGC